MRKDHLKYREEYLYQDKKFFQYNSDTTSLGESLDPMFNKTVLDIGTNNGALLLYASIKGASQLTGCDIFEEALQVADLNLKQTNKPYKLICSKVQDLNIDPVDVIICNPPYFEANTKREDPYYNAAMFEDSMPLKDLFISFRRLVKDNGCIYTLYPADRFNDIYQMCLKYKLKIMWMRFVHDQRKDYALRVILKLKIGPMTKLQVRKPVLIKENEIEF